MLHFKYTHRTKEGHSSNKLKELSRAALQIPKARWHETKGCVEGQTATNNHIVTVCERCMACQYVLCIILSNYFLREH